MTIHRGWFVAFTAVGAIAQFSFLEMFDATRRDAAIISVATFLLTLLAGYLLFQSTDQEGKLNRLGLRVTFCILISALGAFATFVLLASVDKPAALINTFTKGPFLFVGINTVGYAGWLVGIACCLSLLAPKRKGRNPQ